MKTLKTLVAMIAMVMFLGLLPVAAQEGGPGKGRSARSGRGGQDSGGSPVGSLMRLGRHLEITDDQRDAFRELVDGERAENKPVVDELSDIRKAVRELTHQGAFSQNEGEVTTLLERQGELTTSLSLSGHRLKAGFFELLSEEQILKLEEAQANGGGRRGPRQRPREEAP